MKKAIPTFDSDQEAERFIEAADLSEYDLSGGRRVQFEFQKKSATVNIRMSEDLLQALKDRAQQRGIPYQRLIREALEQALSR